MTTSAPPPPHEPSPDNGARRGGLSISQKLDEIISDRRAHQSVADVARARRDDGWFPEKAVRAKLLKFMTLYPGVIPESLFEPLVDHFMSSLLTDASSNAKMSLLETVCIMVGELAAEGSDVDPTNCTFVDAMELITGYRNGLGRTARALKQAQKTLKTTRDASSLTAFVSVLKNLHEAAGNEWVMDDLPSKKADSYRFTLKRWKKEDAARKAAPAAGAKVRRLPPPLGYSTPGPVTLADLAVYNAKHPRDLRDQCWTLLAGETAATLPQLKLLACSAIHVGRRPHVELHKRGDPESPIHKQPISRPLARLLRRLVDSVSKEWGVDAPVFQALARNTTVATWSGHVLEVPGWPAAIRSIMALAAEASPFRTSPMPTVLEFTNRLTPKSPGQGLIHDCIGAGFEVPAVTSYIGAMWADRVSDVKEQIETRIKIAKRGGRNEA